MTGAVLNGKWRLLRLLGEGGMGAVFAAEGLHGEGQRAIKLLHPEFVNEPQVLQRFFAEAYAAQHLEHPNVAKIYEHAQAEDGTPYLVMELLAGIALSEYVQPERPINAQAAAPIVYGVLQALMAAHAQSIVHRDLKPDNIYLVPDAAGRYNVKVLDFGIAKVMDAAGGMGSKTRTGVMLGTPGYMSPEQIKNSKAVDPRSDLWSVGVMFYEMITGKEAFDAPNDFARLTAVLTQEPKPISTVAPALAGWQEFFSRAIARDPAKRFQSADEMARALITTARALAGAAALPTAEFRSVAVQQKAAPGTADVAVLPQRSDGGTRISAQTPQEAALSRASPAAPSVQIVSPPSVQRVQVYDETLKSSPGASGPQVIRVGVRGAIVALIALGCLLVGFLAGFAAAWAAFVGMR
jgi:serine/threonine-protein kinase